MIAKILNLKGYHNVCKQVTMELAAVCDSKDTKFERISQLELLSYRKLFAVCDSKDTKFERISQRSANSSSRANCCL